MRHRGGTPAERVARPVHGAPSEGDAPGRCLSGCAGQPGRELCGAVQRRHRVLFRCQCSCAAFAPAGHCSSNSARSFQCADSGSPHRPAVAELEPGFRTQRGMRSGGRGVQWPRDVFSHRFAQCVGAVCAALRGGLGGPSRLGGGKSYLSGRTGDGDHGQRGRGAFLCTVERAAGGTGAPYGAPRSRHG